MDISIKYALCKNKINLGFLYSTKSALAKMRIADFYCSKNLIVKENGYSEMEG